MDMMQALVYGMSEQLHTNDTRAYSWRGGVWVRIDGEFVAG